MNSEKILRGLLTGAIAYGCFVGNASANVTSFFVNGRFIAVATDDTDNRISVRCGANGNLLLNDARPAGSLIPCDQVRDIILIGGDGDDVIEVVEASNIDFILAGGALVRGGSGNDVIRGAELVSGGAGDDTIVGNVMFGKVVLLGELNDDKIEIPTTTFSQGVIISGPGFDQITGGTERDILIAGDLSSGLDHDVIRGRGSDDILIQSSSNTALMKGGAGRDLLISSVSGSQLRGGGDDDVLIGRSGQILTGGDGNDTIVQRGDIEVGESGAMCFEDQ